MRTYVCMCVYVCVREMEEGKQIVCRDIASLENTIEALGVNC